MGVEGLCLHVAVCGGSVHAVGCVECVSSGCLGQVFG